MRHTERREELLAAEIAADWLQRLKTGGPHEHAEFARWLRESPRNIREMLLASAYQHALSHMKHHVRVYIDALREQCRLEARLTIPHPLTGTRPATEIRTTVFPRPRWRLAAAALVLAAFIAVIAIPALSVQTISTGPGEWHIARLEDGSILHLGPRTRVSVDLNDRERALRLTRGEVMVYVAKDAARPFLVHTNLVTARAVGTAFAVQRRDPSLVSITVSEGVVGVTCATPDKAAVLKAGEQVRVTTGESSLHPVAVNLEHALAWVQGKLHVDETVAEAIREMNLRSRTQIRLLDPAAGHRHITGVFDAADALVFARTLERTLHVSLVDNGRGTLLLSPAQERH
jgi:transmembrane sensor